MLETDEGLSNVARHGDLNPFGDIVPLDGEATEKCSGGIGSNDVQVLECI